MNVLFRPEHLKNQYLGMRHGFSKANEKNIITCSIDRDGMSDGLTKEGKVQVEAAAIEAHVNRKIHKGTIIYSSDFQRCKETAEITAQVIGSKIVRFTHLLRERNFGSLNLKPDENYQKVWDDDLKNPFTAIYGGQSSHAIHLQNLDLFAELEGRYFHKQILLVSHGDRLNIMNTIFLHIKPNLHSTQVKLWQQAEIKEFTVI